MNAASCLIASALLLVPVLARAGCDQRMHAVVETARQHTGAAPLNARGRQFKPIASLSAAWTLDQRCTLGARYSTRLKARVAGAMSTKPLGSEQDAARARLRGEVHEAYLTAQVPGDVLVDIGKKDIRNGYLLFLSPMDIQRTPIAPPPYAVINNEGPSWRSSYREGRIGISATRFLDWGTLEVAALPRLGARPDGRPLAQWDTWQRSNARGALYAAYSANVRESFNPKLVARVSSKQRHVVAIGVSDALSDSVVFTVEAAHSRRSQVQRVTQDAAGRLLAGGFPDAESVLEQVPRNSRQLAAGVRVNGPWQTTWIGEFYYQSDGYSKADWARYFQFTDYALAAWTASGFPPYLDYQRLLLSAADSDQRRYVLPGRRYLTLGVERAAENGNTFGWHASVLGNTDDHSALLNLHLTGTLAPGAEVYLGGRAMLGGRRSEFGRFGQSPLVYLGLDFSL